MSDFEKKDQRTQEFIRKIRIRELRKERGQREKKSNVLFGLSMIGIVGWSVAIPTLIGIALGIWIDKTWSSSHSWTLILLFTGIILGCLNAWYWITNALKGSRNRNERSG